MVGGCENVVVPSVFINPGHVVRFTVDFELGILTLSVNSEIVIVETWNHG